MITKVCDHKSAGILVFQGPKLLLIERAKFPFGFAPPAGHVDEDTSFEEAAKRESHEEVGLKIVTMKLVAEGKKENACSRPEGSWHDWKIYQATVQGSIQRSTSETKQANWFAPSHIQLFAKRTERYLARQTTESDWKLMPGIEVVWYEWFKEFGLL